MRLLQHMDCAERLQVLDANPQYIEAMKEDFPDCGIDDLYDLWLDVCIDYAGYEHFDEEGKSLGSWEEVPQCY